MNNKHALNITDIAVALESSGRVILMSPNSEEYSLTYAFNEAIDTSNARMTNLKEWAKGQNNYSIIETKDWLDFEHKLNRLISAKKASGLLIEYDGYITNYANALTNKETESDLFKELKQNGHGNALYTDGEKTIGFPRLFNSNSHWIMRIPYILKNSTELEYMDISTHHKPEKYSDYMSFINET